MASLSSNSRLLLSRLPSHSASQGSWHSPLDEDDKDPFNELRRARSPYIQGLYDARSVASLGSTAPLVHVNLGPEPSPSAPAAQPVLLRGAAQFNQAQGFSSTGIDNDKKPTQRLFPAAHISSRALTLSGVETLTQGILLNKRPSIITGGLLLGSGVLGTLTALGATHRNLAGQHPKTARVATLSTLVGLLALGGGGFLRQYAKADPNELLSIVAMAILGIGASEAAVTGGIGLARSEQVASTMPSQRRANAALWALDAGVVTTMTYGLATRLNAFPPVADNVILGTAYTAALAGTIWQYADGAWFSRNNQAITPLLKTTWVPTALMVTVFSSKIGVLVGIKFAIDGYHQLSDDSQNIFKSDARARLALILGCSLTLVSFIMVCVPQLAYFYPDLKTSKQAPAKLVAAAVMLGTVLLALGAGLREWGALQGNLALARGAMALAGLGAMSVVACSSVSLAASEMNRGRAPMRRRAEVALGLQTLGLAIGVAFGIGMRNHNYSTLIVDVLEISAYLATGVGGAMSYASTQLDKASLCWVNAEGRRSTDQAIALETLR